VTGQLKILKLPARPDELRTNAEGHEDKGLVLTVSCKLSGTPGTKQASLSSHWTGDTRSTIGSVLKNVEERMQLVAALFLFDVATRDDQLEISLPIDPTEPLEVLGRKLRQALDQLQKGREQGAKVPLRLLGKLP
jgi:hypothetical protein